MSHEKLNEWEATSEPRGMLEPQNLIPRSISEPSPPVLQLILFLSFKRSDQSVFRGNEMSRSLLLPSLFGAATFNVATVWQAGMDGTTKSRGNEGASQSNRGRL